MPTLLSDGFKVKIRTIHADDASMLQAFVRRLSVETRRFRFFSGLVELPASYWSDSSTRIAIEDWPWSH